MSVVSPLGFGLDEEAVKTIEKWDFKPGTKDGKPVKALATVMVSFRFRDEWFNEKLERQRSAFNIAVQALDKVPASPKSVENAITSIRDLSKQGFPAAMYLEGVWQTTGEHGVAKSPEEGLALIQKSAAKNHGPALYEIALREIEGRDLPKDARKGLETMRQSALLGSVKAQFYLGSLYEKGGEVEREPDRARRYFRLCAAQGITPCQLRLGSLMLSAPKRPERDFVQAVAWLQLAAESGVTEATELLAKEAPKLTAAEVDWVNTLKPQLLRKQF